MKRTYNKRLNISAPGILKSGCQGVKNEIYVFKFGKP